MSLVKNAEKRLLKKSNYGDEKISEYSIHVDWQEEYENWNMTGRDLMRSQITEEGTPQNKQAKEEYDLENMDIEEVADEMADHHIPMMNYAYPLDITPSDEKIIEVCERTACTVVEKESTGEYFLALCGGGMDLSQDIALAFIIAQTWLPQSLISQVNKQRGLSKEGKDFDQIKKSIIDQTKMEIERFKRTQEEWKKS